MRRESTKLLRRVSVSYFSSAFRRSEIGVLKNFAKFTRKYLCRSLSFNKLPGNYHETIIQTAICKKILCSKRDSAGGNRIVENVKTF